MKKSKKEFTLLSEFKKFITRGNVVDMAVGVAVASAFTAIVTAFSKGFISPVIALLSNNSTLSALKWVLRGETLDAEGNVLSGEIAIMWGSFLQAIIDFLIIALVMFIFLKIFTAAANKAASIGNGIVDKLSDRDEQAAAKKKAEEEAKALAEAKAAEQAAAAEKEKAECERLRRENNELLREIRDLMKGKQNG